MAYKLLLCLVVSLTLLLAVEAKVYFKGRYSCYFASAEVWLRDRFMF